MKWSKVYEFVLEEEKIRYVSICGNVIRVSRRMECCLYELQYVEFEEV